MNNTTLPLAHDAHPDPIVEAKDAPAAAGPVGTVMGAALGAIAGRLTGLSDAGHSFDAIETELSHGWNTARGVSGLDWDRARNATRDAWNRVSDAADRSDRHGK